MSDAGSSPKSPYSGLEQVARTTPVEDEWIALLPDDARFCVYRDVGDLEEWTDRTIAAAQSRPSQAAVDVYRMLLSITLSGKEIPYCVTAALGAVLDIENHFKRVVATEITTAHRALADIELPEPFDELGALAAEVRDDAVARATGVSPRTIYNTRKAPWFKQEVADWKRSHSIDQVSLENYTPTDGPRKQVLQVGERLARSLIAAVMEQGEARPIEGMRACAYLLGSMSWSEEVVLPPASLNAIGAVLKLVDPHTGLLDFGRLWNTRIPERYREAALADGQSLARRKRRLSDEELKDKFSDLFDAPEVERSIRDWRKADAYQLIEADAARLAA